MLTLKGQLVSLEPLDRQHAADLAKLVIDCNLTQWFPKPIHTNPEMGEFIEKALKAKDAETAIPFVIRHHKDGIIGATRLYNISKAHKRGKIGWTFVGEPWQRTGVNTEAKLLLLTYAFETLQFNRVAFVTDAMNTKSRNAILRIGAMEEGMLRSHVVCKDGRVRNTVCFSILKEEWPGVKERLNKEGLNRNQCKKVSDSRTSATDIIEIVPYQPHWKTQFQIIRNKIAATLGERAIAIHHIGSTSVDQLAAKDIIDIQLTVSKLDDMLPSLLEKAGFEYYSHILRDHLPLGMEIDPEQFKKQFYKHRTPLTNLHVREVGSYNQRYALLCRDYLRAHPVAARAYEEVKRQLARHFRTQVADYYHFKDPIFDLIMEGAENWAKRVQWELPSSDIF